MISANKRATRLDYCQYLLSSQINYTLTNFADHSQQYSHDHLNRYLGGDKLTPRLLWEQVKGSIVTSPNGYLLFDDTVADKNYSFSIELVRRQYSSNTKSIIKGIGHFIGAMPPEFREASEYACVELDPLSARITKLLYPGVSLFAEGFETANLPSNWFGLCCKNCI